MLRRLFRLLKPAFKYTKQSMPVLIFLGLVLLMALIWWFATDWTVFGQKPFDSVTKKIIGILIVLFVMGGIYMTVLVRRNQSMNKEKAQLANDIEDTIAPFERDQEENFKSILSSLKENIPSRNYLYKLPWFIVIGLENSGKTSLINRSGQKFSLTTVERTSRRYQRSDAPYKIDWWVSKDAILIDPDGELLSQQSIEKDEDAKIANRLWIHFVKWLEKTRSRRPLNGIVLVVDLPKLIRSSHSDREAMAGIFRTRIQELIKTLGTRLPVYVVLTKLDLISGFDVFFHKLKESERNSSFGFSFSFDKYENVDSWMSELETKYKEFVGNLNESVFDMMSTLVSQSDREAVYGFIRQMDGSKEILFQYLADILESDRFSTPAIARGVYFTSLFQQGVPQDFMKLSVSGNYRLPVPIPTVTADIKQKTYFSSRLFHDVIYPESGLAGDNVKVARNKRRVFALGSAVAGIGSLMLLAGWNYYYNENKRSADEVIELTTAFSQDRIVGVDDATGKSLLKSMDMIRKASLAFGDYREATPVLEDLGLYQGNKIGKKVSEAYEEILAKKFLPTLAVGLIDEMNRNEKSSDESLSALRVYRMLGDMDNRRKNIAKDWMAKLWQTSYPNDGGTQNKLMEHFDYAMDNVEADLSEFSAIIDRKQHELKQVPLAQRIYRNIKQTADAALYIPLDLRNEVGPAFDEMYVHEVKDSDSKQLSENDSDYSRYQLDSFFTAKGFTEYFVPQSKNIMDLAMVDGWVLGLNDRKELDYSEEDQKKLSAEIREIYIADYINTWRRSLNDLEIVDFKNIPHAVNVLSTLTSSSAPFQRLLKTVKEQTSIYPELTKEEQEASNSIAKNPNRQASLKVGRAFVPLSDLLKSKNDKDPYVDELIKALAGLHSYTKKIQDAPEMGKAALLAVRKRLKLDGADPIFSLKRMANGMPEPLSKQLNQVADHTWKVLLIAAVEELERKWHADVYGFYKKKIVSRYPFVKTASVGISANDFEEFFGPKGRLQVFYDDYLKLFLEDNKGVLIFEDSENSESLIREDFLDNLQEAWDIQDSFFDNKGGLHLEFSLKPLGLSGKFRSSVMDIDGQLVSYNHGPSYAARLIWPNTLRAKVESKLTMISGRGRTERLVYSGTWSWFRLIDKARIIGTKENSIDLQFRIGRGRMSYRLSSDDANNPFIRKPFESFSLPDKLLNSELNVVNR